MQGSPHAASIQPLLPLLARGTPCGEKHDFVPCMTTVRLLREGRIAQRPAVTWADRQKCARLSLRLAALLQTQNARFSALQAEILALQLLQSAEAHPLDLV